MTPGYMEKKIRYLESRNKELEAEIGTLRDDIGNWRALYTQVLVENKKYREALEKILDCLPNENIEMRAIAKAALEGGKNSGDPDSAHSIGLGD